MSAMGQFKNRVAAVAAAALLSLSGAGSAFGYANSVTYSGQGLLADGFGGYDLITEICGVANGAEMDGPYILWVLTAQNANNAEITGPWGSAAMTKFGNGAFKFVSAWYDPDTLPGNVTATYDGRARNAQLVISHGCRPYTHGAWCSPGFWKNASDGAWTLIGQSKLNLFNDTVVPDFYATDSSLNPTLGGVLDYTGPGGANHFGAADAPFGLNAFNATGAFLTNNIPGFSFDPSFVQDDDSETCPIDSHGNLK